MAGKSVCKKLCFFIFLLILILGLFYLYPEKRRPQYKEKKITVFSDYELERLALEEFVDKYFLEEGLFRTNLTDSQQQEIASGEDILSESIGLLMFYYLKKDEPEKYAKQVNILKSYFINSNQLLKWRIRRSIKQETVNATIDDLRIVKALIIAAEKWRKKSYQIMAERLASNLLKYCVIENNLRAYDSANSPVAPFAYYDFAAMRLMGQFDKKWNRLVSINIERIQRNQVVGFPFYKEFSGELSFSTVENLLVMLHLSEVGIKDPQSLIWIKEQLKEGGLFSSYSIAGKALSTVESPAIYAIAAIIGRFNNDQELFSLASEKLKGMQNMQKNQYYGGFIDLNQLSAFSFDQLLALLAYFNK